MFFSSHILADAEALCSRVAVVAGGRLAASGAPDRHPGVRGARAGNWSWPALTPEVLARLRPAAAASTEISPGRYALELVARASARARPAPISSAAGARLVSLNPMRDTLEDFFVSRVAEAGRPDPDHWRRRVRAVSAIAVSVFRESVRDRVPYNLVLFADPADRGRRSCSAS